MPTVVPTNVVVFSVMAQSWPSAGLKDRQMIVCEAGNPVIVGIGVRVPSSGFTANHAVAAGDTP